MIQKINILRVIAKLEPDDVAMLAREFGEKRKRIAAHGIKGGCRRELIGSRPLCWELANCALLVCQAHMVAAINSSSPNPIPTLSIIARNYLLHARLLYRSTSSVSL